MSDTFEIPALNKDIENRYLRSLLEYKDLIRITYNSIHANNFSTDSKGRIFNFIINEWRQDHESPSSDVLKVVIKEKSIVDSNVQIDLRTLENFANIPSPSWAWIVRNVSIFIKSIKLYKALQDSLLLLSNKKLELASNNLVEVLRDPGIDSDIRTNLLDMDKKEAYDIITSEDDICCPTGIVHLDYVIKGLHRNQVMIVLAALNVGKSWATVHFASEAVRRGKYVLYITLEMDRKQVIRRLFQMVASSGTKLSNNELDMEVKLWDNRFENKNEVAIRPTLSNIDIIYRHFNHLKQHRGCLFIEEFASGHCSINDVERAITLFDVTFKKLPDLIIVDGLADMQHADIGGQYRLGLTDTIKQLRKMASDYNASIVVTHQANRTGITENTLGSEHASESIGIMQVADIAIALNQTKAEAKLSEMRVNILRSRHTSKNIVVKLKQALEIGQFCLASEIYTEEDSEDGEEDREQDFNDDF